MIWLHDNMGVLEEPGRPTLLIEISEDVTARKTAERALGQAREYYESLVSSCAVSSE